jgi:hypothetical protein
LTSNILILLLSLLMYVTQNKIQRLIIAQHNLTTHCTSAVLSCTLPSLTHALTQLLTPEPPGCASYWFLHWEWFQMPDENLFFSSKSLFQDNGQTSLTC